MEKTLRRSSPTPNSSKSNPKNSGADSVVLVRKEEQKVTIYDGGSGQSRNFIPTNFFPTEVELITGSSKSNVLIIHYLSDSDVKGLNYGKKMPGKGIKVLGEYKATDTSSMLPRISYGDRSVGHKLIGYELGPRESEAAVAALSRLPELMNVIDRERADDILKSSIAAALPLQKGARAQAELAGRRINEIMKNVPMLTASEVGADAKTDAAKPESLAAQWAARGQVFAVELHGVGLRYPAFQFQETSGKPWPSLAKILPPLRKAFSPIDLLIWFLSPNPAINNRSPVTVLHDLEGMTSIVESSLQPVDFW